MELLEIHHLTYVERGEPLFQPLDLRLRTGMRLGLVGSNGVGKSTLLRLLAGALRPDEGRVARPPGVRLAHLPQGVDELIDASVWDAAVTGLQPVREAEARLRSEERRWTAGEPRAEALAEALDTFEALGGYRAEAELREILAAVGFREGDYARRVSELSGGERRRLALAAVLAGGPEVLLLDEPTNHLDLAMRDWLAQRLARWRGAVVLVSHDRSLLDSATNDTLFLERRSWELRRGGYTRARAARERSLRSLRKRDAERRKEAERLRTMAAELARRGDRSAARRRHTADRQRARLDAAGTADREAADGRASPLELRERGMRGVLLEARRLRRDGVVTVPHLRLEAGQHIALLGPNGSGKSTLLALLAGALASDDARAEVRYASGVRLAVLSQLDRGLDPAVPIVEQLAELVGDGRARHLLADAGVGAARWHALPSALSGGERARAGLALLVAREADIVLLDEPGNDLDLAAVEGLERALRESRAAIVLATHDRRLAESVADEVWTIDEGTLRRYPDVPAYLGGRAAPAVSIPVADDGGMATDGAPAAPAIVAEVPDHGGGAPTRETTDVAPFALGPEAEQPARSAMLRAVESLEDERHTIEQLLEDPLRLGARELERLGVRRAAIEDSLAQAYDALLEPPAPRFRIRECGQEAYADRLGNDLLVLVAPSDSAPRAMELAIHALSGGEAALEPWADVRWPLARVRRSGPVAHIAVLEPSDACLLAWARSCLVDAAARFAFTLLDVTAVQVFTREALPATRLRPAGEGWWSWTRAEFSREEGLPDEPRPRRRRPRHRRGAHDRSRRSGG